MHASCAAHPTCCTAPVARLLCSCCAAGVWPVILSLRSAGERAAAMGTAGQAWWIRTAPKQLSGTTIACCPAQKGRAANEAIAAGRASKGAASWDRAACAGCILVPWLKLIIKTSSSSHACTRLPTLLQRGCRVMRCSVLCHAQFVKLTAPPAVDRINCACAVGAPTTPHPMLSHTCVPPGHRSEPAGRVKAHGGSPWAPNRAR